MTEEEWKPNRKLIDWAVEHVAKLSVGGMWAPEGTGLVYVKTTEKTLLLRRMSDLPETLDNHERMKVLMFDAGVTIIEDENTERIPAPQSQEEAMIQEVELKRIVAESWADADGTLLIDMDLHEIYPTYVESAEVLLEDGETDSIEIWAYEVTNPNTGEQLSIDPDDYHILMGDMRFMQFRNTQSEVFHALTREQIIETTDTGGSGLIVGSKCPHTGEKIPPWMYGTYCMIKARPFVSGDEEE